MKPRTPSHRRSSENKVVVDVDLDDDETLEDVDEPVLSFHAPSELQSTFDMTEVTEEEARNAGAVACSECYRDVDGMSYDFQYLQRGSA